MSDIERSNGGMRKLRRNSKRNESVSKEPDLESELYNRVANRNFRRAVGAGVGRRGEQCVRDDIRLLGLHSE